MDIKEKSSKGLGDRQSSKGTETNNKSKYTESLNNTQEDKKELIVTVFSNLSGSGSKYNAPMSQIAAEIKNGKWAKEVKAVQALVKACNLLKKEKDCLPVDANDQNKILEDKIKALEERIKAEKQKAPLIKFTATFEGGTSYDFLAEPTGLIVGDIDNLNDPEERQKVKERLIADPHTYFLTESISGEGIRVIFIGLPTKDRATYRAQHTAMGEHINNPNWDVKCSDLIRGSFPAADPNCHYNPNAKLWTLEAKQKTQKNEALELQMDEYPEPDHEITDEHLIDATATLGQLIAGPDPMRLTQLRPKPFLEESAWNDSILWIAGGMALRGYPQELTKKLMWENKYINYTGSGQTEFNKTLTSAYKHHEKAAAARETQKKEEIGKFIRVGDTYFKRTRSIDQYGQPHNQLVHVSRQTLIDDYGKDFLKRVPKFDNFCNVPHNIHNKTAIGRSYNLYSPSEHVSQSGDWYTIKLLLTHVFGEQYEIGLDYIQLLYLRPTQLLPILCLVSKENETGKTTFGRFLNMIFGGNACMLGSSELVSEFNGSYASKLCIVVDETHIAAKNMSRIKMLATADKIQLRKMHQDHSEISFFGKFILLSNDETSFISANREDLRYWVRKLSKLKSFDPEFNDKIKAEVPAFLHFLQSRELATSHKSRMYFSPEILKTAALEAVREGSKSRLRHEVEYAAITHMESRKVEFIECTVDDIHMFLLYSDKRWTRTEIRDVLKHEMGLEPIHESKRYKTLGGESKPGRFYTLRLNQLKPNSEYDDLL